MNDISDTPSTDQVITPKKTSVQCCGEHLRHDPPRRSGSGVVKVHVGLAPLRSLDNHANS